MKKIYVFTLLFAFCALLTSCGGGVKYVIEGTGVEGNFPDGEYAYLQIEKSPLTMVEIIDSVKVENGYFRFEGKLDKPAIANIATSFRDGENLSDGLYKFVHCRFIIEDGNIEIREVGKQRYRLTMNAYGTPFNDGINEFYKGFEETGNRIRAIEDEEKRNNNTLYADYLADCISANANNALGAYIIGYAPILWKAEPVLKHIAKFPDWEEYFSEMKSQNEKLLRVSAGQPYVDFTAKRGDGEKVSLKSVIENSDSRYLLLDFWASWCVPCIYSMPELKRLYDEYHSKGFEILGVSLDDNKAEWTKTIEDNGLVWPNVISGTDGQAVKEYSIIAIPTAVLIDCKTGEIVEYKMANYKLEDFLRKNLK